MFPRRVGRTDCCTAEACLTTPIRVPTADPPFFEPLRRALESADAGATILYRKLEMAVRAALTDGLLEPGASLPGERELAEGLELSRATVRKALDSLVAEGFLVRRHGARTAVAARIEKPLASSPRSPRTCAPEVCSPA